MVYINKLSLREVCHLSKIYLSIDGFKLEKGKLDLMKETFLLADQPFHSMGCVYVLKSNRKQFIYLLKSLDNFLIVFESVDSLNLYGL